MLTWAGTDQQMKMRETSRGRGKKPYINNRTTQSAMYGGASARVMEYTNDINDRLLPALRQKFGGLRMTVV